MTEKEYDKLYKESLKTIVTITDDPKINTGRWIRGNWNYDTVRYGETSWQDEFWEKQKKLLEEKADCMFKRDNLESDINSHMTKRVRVF